MIKKGPFLQGPDTSPIQLPQQSAYGLLFKSAAHLGIYFRHLNHTALWICVTMSLIIKIINGHEAARGYQRNRDRLNEGAGGTPQPKGRPHRYGPGGLLLVYRQRRALQPIRHSGALHSGAVDRRPAGA